MILPPLPRFVRFAPRIFYAIGVLDFVKNLLPMYTFYQQWQQGAAEYSTDVRMALYTGVLGAVVFAAGWFVYGIFATILLSIHDQIRASGPFAPAGGDAPTEGASE